ncbi:S8 family serine peptidase, partial [bacterium]|nr:S8 family serine peptidase [bacterium]
MMRLLATWGITLLLLAGSTFAGEIHPALEDQLDRLAPSETVKVVVFMSEQVPTAELNRELKMRRASRRERHRQVVEALQDATRSQRDLIAYLETSGDVLCYRSHWIANLIVLTATRAEIETIAARDDVLRVEPNFEPELIAPMGEFNPSGEREIGITEGLVAVRAPEVWYELGYTGLTRLVGSFDTGVDGNHEALASRWRGNHEPWQECWLDVLDGGTSFPLDLDGHGTHTCGTITGVAPDDSVGVAWGAEWIACNGIDQPVSEDFDNDVFTCLEWFTDPDGDPGTVDDVPDVIQNSWGVGEHLSYPSCFDLWWTTIDNLEAAGTVAVWSAGNNGPDPSSMGSPADRAASLTNCFSVGAVDATNFGWPYPIANFSSRGPTTCEVDPGLEVKPEVVAPGVHVYSSLPGGIYGYNDGTSMSGPHVAGVVALMRQANPNLDVDSIKQIIMDTAADLGDPGEENTYGNGLVDAYAAVSAVIDGFGIVDGSVVNGSWLNLPLPGAKIEILGNGYTWFTDEDGIFYGLAAPGDYTIQASMPGFEPQDFPITVIGESNVMQDFVLLDVAGPSISDVSEPITLPGGGQAEAISANILDYSTVTSATLHFRINGGDWTTEPMNLRNGEIYAGDLPPVPVNTAIDYYVSAVDGLSQEASYPAGAPGDFLTLLATEQIYAYAGEDPPDFQWRLGMPGDDATGGQWVRVDPVGTEQSGAAVNPEDDHTPDPGIKCFVTGSGAPGENAFANDVDDGCTTLQSPLFDLSQAEKAYVNYWRWFANVLVTADDEFLAEISSDGGASWVTLERETLNQNYWRETFIDLASVNSFTGQVPILHVVRLYGLPSMLSAPVDDLPLGTLPGTNTRGPDLAPRSGPASRLP